MFLFCRHYYNNNFIDAVGELPESECSSEKTCLRVTGSDWTQTDSIAIGPCMQKPTRFPNVRIFPYIRSQSFPASSLASSYPMFPALSDRPVVRSFITLHWMETNLRRDPIIYDQFDSWIATRHYIQSISPIQPDPTRWQLVASGRVTPVCRT